MIDDPYKYMPLVGFFVYLRPRFRLLIAILIGWSLTTMWLVDAWAVQHTWFAYLSTVLIAVLYLIFLRQLIADKARLFSTEVQLCIWSSGCFAVTVFAVCAISKMYLG